MNATNEFGQLIERMAQAICRGDAAAVAECFVTDGTYNDGFYGEFRGREAIADMVVAHFHAHASDFEWKLADVLSDGRLGYARYAFSYTSTLPENKGVRVFFPGIAHVTLKNGLIDRYDEIFNRGMALVQMNFAPERIAKSLKRWSEKTKERME